MYAYKGTFTANTGTGNQTVSGIVDETGAAFTPKAVILWSNYGTTTGFLDGYSYSFGFADGTTAGAVSTTASDNVATIRAAGSTSATGMACKNAATSTTITRLGAFSSFGSGQFVINWSTADGVAPTYHYLALGGSELNVAGYLDELNRFPGAAFASITSPAAFVNFAGLSTTSLGHTGIGFLAWWNAVRNQALAIAGIDDSTTSTSRRIQRKDRVYASMAVSGAGVFNMGGVDGLGTFWDVLTDTSNAQGYTLALSGIAAACGSGLQPTATGTQAVSGLGFSPKCVLIASIGNVAITNTTVANDAKISVGGADRTRQGHAVAACTAAANPSVCVTKYDTTNIVTAVTANATAASSTIDAQAALQSIDADGFTLNWTTADATQREYIWLALGDVPAAGGGGGEHAHTFFGTGA